MCMVGDQTKQIKKTLVAETRPWFLNWGHKNQKSTISYTREGKIDLRIMLIVLNFLFYYINERKKLKLRLELTKSRVTYQILHIRNHIEIEELGFNKHNN